MLEHQNFFILGIKGAGMVNIAALLKAMGKTVTGVDVAEIFPTDVVLEKEGIVWTPFDQISALPENTDVVIYSAAHGGKNHPLVKEAIGTSKEVYHQAEILGELMQQFQTSIAVAGCHGKTTTSSLLAYALLKLDKNPSFIIGAPSFNEYQGNHLGNKDFFVIEADEYALHPPEDRTPKFHFLKPTYAIITNIDFDHPDVYNSFEDTKEAFRVFIDHIVSSGLNFPSVVACGDDAPLKEVLQKFPKESYLTYGFGQDNDFVISNAGYGSNTSFTVSKQGKEMGTFTMALPGEKNILNATAVVIMLDRLGIPVDQIQNAILEFTGAKRRFEKILEKNGTVVFDDYAHHPQELDAILQAARSRYPEKKIHLVFQPHTFSRTEKMAQEFREVFKKADAVIILPVFASAREQISADSFTNIKLAEGTQESILAATNDEDAISKLKNVLSGNDVILMAGAGDVYKLQPAIVAML